MPRPRLHSLATTTILLAVWAGRLLDVTAQSVDQDPVGCRRYCDVMNFFRRFRINNTDYQNNQFLPNCYANCSPLPAATDIQPPPTTRTTATTSTTTTTTTTSAVFRSPGCGIQTMDRYRIVGGTDAGECEFPWAVGIAIGNNFCGGTILDDLHILTAAHCFKDRRTGVIVDKSQVTVRVGSSLMSRLRVYTVVKLDLDPRHVRVINDYDVAVLTLSSRLTFSDCVAAVCLPEPMEDPRSAELCVAAGWGVEYQNSDLLSANLQKVTLPIVDNSLCEQSYGSRYINALKLCAGNFYNGGIDSCQGDSGGPLTCKTGNRYVIYGVVSFGSGCARARFPGVYTYIAHPDILSFIKSILRIN